MRTINKSKMSFSNSIQWLLQHPIAHRGLHKSSEVPENSLLAFQLAAAANYPIELDVHLTADGKVVVMHDYELKRLTGREGLINEISSIAVRELRLLGTEEPVPFLQDVLNTVAGKVPLVIEIKHKWGRIGKLEDAVLKELTEYKGQYAIQSFNPWSLAHIYKTAPYVTRGQLSYSFVGANLGFFSRFALKNLLWNWKSKPHYVALDINSLPSLTANCARATGKPLIAWTVKTWEQQKQARLLADNYIFEGIDPFKEM